MHTEFVKAELYFVNDNQQQIIIGEIGEAPVIKNKIVAFQEIPNYVDMSFNYFYQKWQRKKKGKRYVPYQVIKQGIDPKVLEKIKVVKK